jgi:hypothetical protein
MTQKRGQKKVLSAEELPKKYQEEEVRRRKPELKPQDVLRRR